MTQTNDKIIDRDQLQAAYVESILAGMDPPSMSHFVYESLNGNFDTYTVDALLTDVKDK